MCAHLVKNKKLAWYYFVSGNDMPVYYMPNAANSAKFCFCYMIESFSNLCALSLTDCLTECFLGRSLSYMAGINNQTPSQPLLVSSRLPYQQDAVGRCNLPCEEGKIGWPTIANQAKVKVIHLLTLTFVGTA